MRLSLICAALISCGAVSTAAHHGPDDAAPATTMLLAAVSGGELTPTEANELTGVLESHTRAVEVSAFEQRIQARQDANHQWAKRRHRGAMRPARNIYYVLPCEYL